MESTFPSGMVTLVFTDLEGSSNLSERYGAAFEAVRREHFHILRESVTRCQGLEVETAGDSLFAVFTDAAQAVSFAVEVQLALQTHEWPPGIKQIHVRIGMHTGEPFLGIENGRITYRGPATNRAARIMAAAQGGQVLVSATTRQQAEQNVPIPISFLDVGMHVLKGVGEEHLWQVCHPDLTQVTQPEATTYLNPDTRCHIEMLGSLRVRRGEHVVSHFETRKTATLLARLALLPNRDHPREELAELLWPDEDPDATRPRLRQALTVLRRVLEPEGTVEGSALVADRTNVRLNFVGVTTDVMEFQNALQGAARAVAPEDRARSIGRAVEFYRGDLLPGFYDDWLLPERQRLADAHLTALIRLANARAEMGDINAAIDTIRQAVAADVLREESHCDLMRFYAAAGRTADVVRHFTELERVLKEQLNAAPAPGTRRLFEELRNGVPEPPAPVQPSTPAPASTLSKPVAQVVPIVDAAPGLEPVGGAVPLGSRFYIERLTDDEFKAAIARQDSIVLVKGPREVGKTSLLARGLHQARTGNRHVVLTDFQKLTAEQLQSTDVLFLTLAESIADQLDLEVLPDEVWNAKRGWNVNFERYLRREVLNKLDAPLVWGLDEVDRLFTFPYSSEVFGLFRSWHNERALDPTGPWSKLTLGIAYALEAHLFITDLNQSPFNVGTRLTLEDFKREQVAELNRRYDSPLKNEDEIERFFYLIGGHPGLTRRGLHEMVTHHLDIATFEFHAEHDEGAFRDHLHRIVILLQKSSELCAAVKAVLCGEPCADRESFYRLRSAGIIIGDSPEDARFRCRLYQSYLERHLK